MDKLSRWQFFPSRIRVVALDYFHNLYTSGNPSIDDLLIASFAPCISDAMNVSLTRDLDDDEIKKVAFAIDDLTSLFFQNYWDIIRRDICTAVKDFSSSGRLLKNINHTVITLIPKVK